MNMCVSISFQSIVLVLNLNITGAIHYAKTHNLVGIQVNITKYGMRPCHAVLPNNCIGED